MENTKLLMAFIVATFMALLVVDEIVSLIRAEGVPSRVKFFFLFAGVIYCLMAIGVVIQFASQV